MADVIEEELDLYDDETSAEREARIEAEEGLDEISQMQVDQIVDRLLIIVDELSGLPLYGYQRPIARRIIESLIIGDGATITAIQARQCLDADAIVFAQDGTASRLRDMPGASMTGHKPTKRYTLRGGAELVMTDEHLVFTEDGIREAGTIEVGDSVSMLSYLYEWLDEQVVDRVIEVGRHRTKTRIVQAVNSDLAKFLGYLTTDGSHRPGQSMKFTNNRAEYLHEMVDLSQRLFELTPKWYEKGNGYDLIFSTDSKSSYVNRALDVVHALAWDHGFPTDVFRWNPEIVSDFVNRAWSGDGCITMKAKGPEVFLACGNDEVYAAYWQSLLLKFGVTSQIKREQLPKGTGTFHRLVLGCGETNLERFFNSFGLIYGKEEASARAMAFFATRQRGGGKGYPLKPKNLYRVNGDGPDGEELVWSKVVKIEDAGVREVWDPHVPGKGWVIAQGLQVSNSGKSEVVANTIAACLVMLPILSKVFPDLLDKFSRGLWVGCFAPTDDQAEIVYSRIVSRLTSDRAQEMFKDPDINERVTKGHGNTMHLRNGSLIRRQTAHPRSNIEGRTYHLMLVDECQDADARVINKCVVEGTSVWTPVGPAPIEDVVKNQRDILTYDGVLYRDLPGELEGVVPATPSEWIDNGTRDVWRVTTSTGRVLEATEDHRWLVRDRVGNRQVKIAMTKELSVGQTLPLTRDAFYFGSRGSQDEGYYAGQLLGDGCLRGSSVKWCGFRDSAFAEMSRIAASLGDELHVWNVQSSGLQEVGLVGGGSLRFAREHGLWGLKGEDKALQHSDYSAEFYVGFIAGLIDSDGCVTTNKVSVSTISETMMRQLQESLLRLGINSHLDQRPNNGGYASTNPLWTVTIKTRDDVLALRALVTLHAQDKDARLTALAERVAGKASRRSSNDPRRGYPSGVVFDPIVSIEYAGRKQTYCVTVSPTHTVIWDGVVGLNSIGPMGASTNATMVFIGTPSYHKGAFYSTIQSNKRQATKRGARQNHFEVDWKEVAKWNKNYGKFVKKEMLRIGEDSDEFRLAYRLHWLLDKGMFTTAERVEELGDKSMEVVHAWNKSPVVVGIDPARKQDSTIVTVVWVDWDRPDEFGFYEHRILNWMDLSGVDWETQYARIVDFLANYSIFAIGVDEGGLGDPVISRLRVLMPDIPIIGVQSDRATQSKRWKLLKNLMERGKIGWPYHAKTRRLKTFKRFAQQMEDLELIFEGPYVVARAPKAADAHDDYPDSLAIACIVAEDHTVPEVEVSHSPFYAR